MRSTGRKMAIVLAALIAVSGVGWLGLNEAHKTAELSCISSIANELAKRTSSVPLGSEWRVLSDSEAKDLLGRIVPYDCPNRVLLKTATRNDGTLLDAWGRQFKIALRREHGGVNIRVWSTGRDGRSGTADDLVIPWSEKAISP